MSPSGGLTSVPASVNGPSLQTIWLIGPSNFTTRFASQLQRVFNTATVHPMSAIEQVSESIRYQSTQAPAHCIFVFTTGLTYSDFDELATLTRRFPNVPITICFTSQHLGYVSYAWGFNFAAYLAADDLPDIQYALIEQVVARGAGDPMYSPVFRAWLRQYGIQFEGDNSSLNY
jgi:hypothetical protein